MKKLLIITLALVYQTAVIASDKTFEVYILNFDYDARKEMKMNSTGLKQLLMEDGAQLIDIRFKEEYQAWKVGPSINIPINELPGRLNEIDKNKILVTACPHKDRAIVAMSYLRSKGINARYLTDGLIGLAEKLRGDDAEEFIYTREMLKK